eukprot:1197180-Rhodomonas_salina.2
MGEREKGVGAWGTLGLVCQFAMRLEHRTSTLGAATVSAYGRGRRRARVVLCVQCVECGAVVTRGGVLQFQSAAAPRGCAPSGASLSLSN